VSEHEAASAALDAARAEAAVIQAQIIEANAKVAAAADVANSQRKDVVDGINAAIVALQELLASI
jgi:hypothetical protein